LNHTGLHPNLGWHVARASAHFGGRAGFDEIEFLTKGFAGLTPRLYDPGADTWSMYWASKRTGTLFPPVVGRFALDGTGIQGNDEHDGHKVKVRFIWSGITATTGVLRGRGQAGITNWRRYITRCTP
jgi:hypothetical protein